MEKKKSRYGAAMIPFIGVHIAAIVGVILVGFSWWGVALCVGLYYLRMFGITAGYHRYFAHRAFKTNRVFQFILALIGGFSVQKGALWWAAHHRDHHKYSDTEQDIHSPRQRGLFWAHMGWFLSDQYNDTKMERIKDFAKYPELRVLNKMNEALAAIMVVALFLAGGWTAVVYGFCLSTVLLWHGTFTINSLTHRMGTARYKTGDDAKNSFILSLITMGEGWHNNHHYYQSTANQGWFWWEIDMSYYILKGLSWVGVVSDLRKPPERVLRGEIKGPMVKLKEKRAVETLSVEEPLPEAA
jgi:stearoyl-CoA desaturase (Delta-9 desaturase)